MLNTGIDLDRVYLYARVQCGLSLLHVTWRLFLHFLCLYAVEKEMRMHGNNTENKKLYNLFCQVEVGVAPEFHDDQHKLLT